MCIMWEALFTVAALYVTFKTKLGVTYRTCNSNLLSFCATLKYDFSLYPKIKLLPGLALGVNGTGFYFITEALPKTNT